MAGLRETTAAEQQEGAGYLVGDEVCALFAGALTFREQCVAALTETVVRRFFLKHNKAKLEVPGFIANLMKLPDDEIRSKCQARYHATPEPARDDFDI